MHFLVVDSRFGTPIHVFLECDPSGEIGGLTLAAREVALEAHEGAAPAGRFSAIGRDPAHRTRFRAFSSEGTVSRAGFILIEPCYVGTNWGGYCDHFRPEGEKPVKRLGRAASRPHTGR